MKVILLQDVKKVGKKNQTVEVSDGFATNFLFPRKLAVQVTQKSREILANQQEEARINEENAKKAAQELAKNLEGIVVEFKAKTGKDGKMFGNISSKQIADELKAKHNIDVDKRKFVDKISLNMLGYYDVKVELHKGVIATIRVHISKEGE